MDKRGLAWFAGCLTLLAASAGPLGAGGPQRPAGGPAPSVSLQRALIDQYCVGCHNDKAKTAGLALDTVDVARVGENAEVWEKAVRKLRGRMMPPPGRPRPDEAAYDSFVSYLETSLDRAAAAGPNPRRTDTFRRLTRTEYQNAIRDLLGLDVDVASLLPKDDSSFGFDNVTVGGSLQRCWNDTWQRRRRSAGWPSEVLFVRRAATSLCSRPT